MRAKETASPRGSERTNLRGTFHHIAFGRGFTGLFVVLLLKALVPGLGFRSITFMLLISSPITTGFLTVDTMMIGLHPNVTYGK